MFASGLLIPYLVLVMLQLLTLTSLDLYSSGLSLQAMGIRVPRWGAVIIDASVCCVLTAVVVLSAAFDSAVTTFLSFMIIWVAPWVGIYLVDWWLRRGHYDGAALASGTYGDGRRRQIHAPA